ncbi:hypothetical protein AKO1_012363, partial [Acrasis kona]
MPILFQLYCFVTRTILNVKSSCEEIMTTYFKKSSRALDVIKKLLLFDDRKQQLRIEFCAGPNGGVCVKSHQHFHDDSIDRQQEEYDRYIHQAQCIIQLLKLIKNESVAGDLFMHLITQFTALKIRDRDDNIKLQSQLGIANESSLPTDTMLLLHSIQLMIQHMGVSIMKNTSQAIRLVKLLLLCRDQIPPSQDDHEQDESITMALGLLSAILNGAVPIQEQERVQLQDLIPILSSIRDDDQQVSEMCSACLLSIRTQSYTIHHDKGSNESDRIKMCIDNVLSDLKDPLLPIRAHGIMCLRNLVLKDGHHPIMKQQIESMLNIFVAHLKDDDSYVYLGAVQGLCALGDLYPDRIIPTLTRTYCEDGVGGGRLDATNACKVGEALVNVARRCGAVLPKHAHHFMRCMMTVVRNGGDDDLLRASALSNLSTLMALLRFAVHPYLVDVMSTVCLLLERPKSHSRQVKSACIHILSGLVNAMGKELRDVMHGHEQLMSDMVDVLHKVRHYDGDDVIRHDAGQVLEEIDAVEHMRLMPQMWLPGGDGDDGSGTL